MGTPEYADKILEKLILDSNFEIIAVFTQPDKPVGRKKIITQPPVKITAVKNDIPVFQPHRLRESAETIKNLNPDFIVVGAYGQILSQEILDIAPSINLHTSILPKYRGASPIQQALLNGNSETGVTAMKMNIGLDTGDILKIEKVKISDSWLLEDLYQTLTDMAGDLIIDVLKNYDNLTPIPQKDSDATHCGKILKTDGKISFQNADEVLRKYRAFTPWPSIYLNNGMKLLHIAQGIDGTFESGKILKVGKNSILVGCENGSIEIFEVQPKSKNKMSMQSYINGRKLKVGDIFDN